MVAHMYKENGHLAMGSDSATKASDASPPSPLVSAPSDTSSRAVSGNPSLAVPKVAPSVPDNVMMDASASKAAGTPSPPAYQKSPVLCVRSQRVPWPSPYAARPKGRQDAACISKPSPPIPPSQSTSHPASRLTRAMPPRIIRTLVSILAEC